MNNKITYYQKIKTNYQIEKKNIMKITKEDCESIQEINIENYLMKKKP